MANIRRSLKNDWVMDDINIVDQPIVDRRRTIRQSAQSNYRSSRSGKYAINDPDHNFNNFQRYFVQNLNYS